jgi:hypothetical protein
MLSAEQQFVVDGTTTQPFWEYWMDRHVNHNDTTEDGFPIVRCQTRHYVVKPWKNPKRYREFGGGSSLGFGGHEWKFTMADGTILKSNDVWFQGVIPLTYQQFLPNNAEMVDRSYADFAPFGTAEEATLRQLSVFDHPTMAVDFVHLEEDEIHDGTVYTKEWDEEHRRPAPLAESQVWTSEVRNVTQPGPSVLGWGGGGITIGSVGEDNKPIVHNPQYGAPKATWFNGKMQQVQDGWHTVMVDIDKDVRLVPSTTSGHWHLYIDVAMPWWRYRKLLRALKNAGIIEPGYYRASIMRGHTALRLPWVKKEALKPKAKPEGDLF